MENYTKEENGMGKTKVVKEKKKTTPDTQDDNCCYFQLQIEITKQEVTNMPKENEEIR